MKIKKNSESILQVMKSVTDIENIANPTFLSLDLNGGLVVESFSKLLDYDNDKISISAAGKTIYIYGENMKITTFSKSVLHVQGSIIKIELFEVK